MLKLQPDSLEALGGRAWAWMILENPDKALADFNALLERDAKNVNALVSRGIILAAGRPDDALRDADAALTVDPHCAEAFRLRGWVYLMKGELKSAIAALNRSIELEPDNSNFLTTRATCWMAQGEFDKAIDDYTAAIKLSPEEAQHWGNRGRAWWMKSELSKSLSDCNEAIRLDPKSPTWVANRGALHLKMSDYSAAIADLKQALAIGPKTRHARYRLAWIYACIPDDKVRSGETALKVLTPILESEEDDGEFACFAAEAMAATMAENGNFKLAVKSQHFAVGLAETEEEIRAARERLALYEAGKPYRLPAKRR
jgi:tetratricopeptide (TPR) repeat protein